MNEKVCVEIRLIRFKRFYYYIYLLIYYNIMIYYYHES